MTLTEGNDVPQAFVLDGTNKPLGVGVQVRAVRGQPQHSQAGGLQDAAKVGRVERVSVNAASVRLRPIWAIHPPSARQVTPAM